MKDNAGRFVDGRMVWTRTMDVPVERVWEAVSTSAGLDNWWMAGSRNEIDLRPGGLFRHHWKSTITDLEKHAYIDLQSEPGFGRQRFELRAHGEGTTFSFIELMKPGTRPDPAFYCGPAAGYHAMIDALEMHLTGKKYEVHAPRDAHGRPPAGSYEDDLIEFYRKYLVEELAT